MRESNNSLKYYESILTSIASAVIVKTAGAISMASAEARKLSHRSRLKNGMQLFINEDEVTLDISVFVDSEYKVPDVAFTLQENVKHEIEAATMFKVKAVNVKIVGVNFPA